MQETGTAASAAAGPGTIIDRLRSACRARFVRNVGWMGAANALGRVFRLGATIVAARVLLPEDYGLAAIVLVVHEAATVVARGATTTTLVQTAPAGLERCALSAWSFGWVLGVTLFAAQWLLALALCPLYDTEDLLLPLGVLAATHLMVPVATVQAALNIRSGRLDVVARVDVAQSFADATLTVILAVAGLGVWALVLPKLLVVPIWIVAHRRCCRWRGPRRPDCSGWPALLAFGSRVVAVDLLTVVRNQADYVLVGKLLGVEALGIYYFAYNAGIGISLGVTNAFSAALLPHLCGASEDRRRLRTRFRASLAALALLVAALVAAQCVLAPVYVPLIFGERWVELGAVPVLVLICLSALPRALGQACSQLLRAVGLPGLDLRLGIAFTALFIGSVAAAAPFGLEAVAAAVLVVSAGTVPVIGLIAWRAAFGAPVAPGPALAAARPPT